MAAGIIWGDEHLFEYLLNPKKYIPGTKMVRTCVRTTDVPIADIGGNGVRLK